MKKRKSCTLSQTRLQRETGILPRVRSTQDLNSKSSSKTSHTSPRNRRQVQTRNTGVRLKSSLSSVVSRKETFKSLESLFDLHKQFELSIEDFPHYYPPLEEGTENQSEESTTSEYQFGKPEDFIENLKPVFADLETDDKLPECAVDDAPKEDLELTLENLEKVEDIPILSEIEEDSTSEMADNPAPGSASKSVTNASQAQDNLTSRSNVTNQTTASNKDDCGKSVYAPDYPLPPGVGEGIPVGDCKNRDSLMSTFPITESCMGKEMARAEERARCIMEEIKELKKVIEDLSDKADLTVDDTIVLKDTQTSVMQKIGELNEITRKLQRTIGLVDPSTAIFAKMFDMLPYPHNKQSCRGDQGRRCENESIQCSRECERFAFPQVDHPEDKLPRVIICGKTEENFPPIVIADSRPKSRGNPCLQNLTGRLSESLTMQEKLAKENAQLEGGKYQLEKELLEKDNAVECLQRKICGLQAEMRIVVKENSELSRKVLCLAQQQQQQPKQHQRSTSPCSQPIGTLSSRSTPGVGRTPCSSPRKQQLDLSCKCSARAQQNVPPPSDNCHSPRENSPNSCRDRKSPRLAGGGSRSEMYNRTGTSNNCAKSPPLSSQSQRGGGGGGGAGQVCPAEIEERLAAYGNNTKHLGDQLSCIETEVRTLQAELMNVQRERQQLEQQRKLLECAGPCATCICCPELPKSASIANKNQDPMACSPCNDSSGANECAVQQLRDLREQYARLQDDYKSKLCEVSRLRADAETLRRDAREAKEERERMEIKLIDAQERSRAIEAERNELLGTKEQLVEQEQALLVARQRFREAQDELEELRTMIRDQAAQLDDYRNKYLQAQQQVEEQRRQLDLMEMDNARMNENVTLEIGRVKNQFQEKLAELAPLPDILKQTQLKLQESQQLRMLAEHNCEDLSRELLGAKDKIDSMQAQINDLQREIQALNDDKNDGGSRIEELERKNSEYRNENERLKNSIARLEEQQAQVQKRLDEKQHEIVQLTAMLEQVREDSARQVSRTKERCEAIKRSMQAQISDFEIQLAQCRAAAKTAQKERDEIRQKMQGQIVNLNEALQQAQGRIRSLQGHVDYLKVSYSNVFGQGSGESPTSTAQAESPIAGQGYDSCDCNY